MMFMPPISPFRSLFNSMHVFFLKRTIIVSFNSFKIHFLFIDQSFKILSHPATPDLSKNCTGGLNAIALYICDHVHSYDAREFACNCTSRVQFERG